MRKEIQIQTPEQLNLGDIQEVKHIPTNPEADTFHKFEKPLIYRPETIGALQKILEEYTNAFTANIHNRQPNNYHLAKDQNGRHINFGFQIDLAPIPETTNHQELGQTLKARIFEIENSLAMYNMMRGIFSPGDTYSPQDNFFGYNFDAALDLWRQYTGKPIYLGAVTQEKFQHMLLNEFGLHDYRDLNPQYVRSLSGFDGFVGPWALKKMAQRQQNAALYMRTSYPKQWLKNPTQTSVDISLLEDPGIRAYIQQRAITFNVDTPQEVNFIQANLDKLQAQYDPNKGFYFTIGDGYFYPSIINDSKEALARMELVMPVTRFDNVIVETKQGKVYSYKYTDQVKEFLATKGYDPETGETRLKPLWLHYGAYGHVLPSKGPKTPESKQYRQQLRAGLRKRGPYVLQPEIPPYTFSSNGTTFQAIHRLFFAFDPFKQSYQFIGGLFNAIPSQHHETARGRIHGTNGAVWGLIATHEANLVVDQNSLNTL